VLLQHLRDSLSYQLGDRASLIEGDQAQGLVLVGFDHRQKANGRL
jgi:hypothetical protein